MTELKEEIKQKLSEAVELYADENLVGKPAILCNCIYLSLEKTFLDEIEKINKTFK